MKTKTAYSYIRFSSNEQESGDSIRRQTELCQKYCDNHNLKLVEDQKFYDYGISAFHDLHAKQGNLSVFLQLCLQDKIPKGSYLLVESLDRLSRNKLSLAQSLINSILDSGVNIVTLSNSKVYSQQSQNDISTAIEIMLELYRANQESELKSLRIGKAWSNKRNKAREGVIFTKRCPEWLEVINGQFQPIPERVKVIELIFQLASQGYGKQKIKTVLNEKGIKPFKHIMNKKPVLSWGASSVQKVLCNRSLIGEYQPYKNINGKKRQVDGEPIPDYYPKVISEELFFLINSRTKNPVKGSQVKISNLFSGLIKCHYCGASYNYINKGKWQYLICYNAIKGGYHCKYRSIPYKQFENDFFKFIHDLKVEKIVSPDKSILTDQQKLISLQGMLSDKQKAIDNLLITFSSHKDKEIQASLQRTIESTSSDISELKIEIENILERLRSTKQFEKSVTDSIDKIRQNSSSGDYESRLLLRTAIRDLISKIVVYWVKEVPLYLVVYKNGNHSIISKSSTMLEIMPDILKLVETI
jgi:DNA invertase Pin-like site-specific DNA recombinase